MFLAARLDEPASNSRTIRAFHSSLYFCIHSDGYGASAEATRSDLLERVAAYSWTLEGVNLKPSHKLATSLSIQRGILI